MCTSVPYLFIKTCHFQKKKNSDIRCPIFVSGGYARIPYQKVMLGTGGSFVYNTRVQSVLWGTSGQDLEAAGHMHGLEFMFIPLSLLL